MTEINYLRCDGGCNNRAEEAEARHWLHVQIKTVKEVQTTPKPLHFDSWDCLVRYGQNKVKEQEPHA